MRQFAAEYYPNCVQGMRAKQQQSYADSEPVYQPGQYAVSILLFFLIKQNASLQKIIVRCWAFFFYSSFKTCLKG